MQNIKRVDTYLEELDSGIELRKSKGLHRIVAISLYFGRDNYRAVQVIEKYIFDHGYNGYVKTCPKGYVEYDINF